MATRFSVAAVFKAVDRFSAPISRMQNRVQKMTRSMSRGFNKLNRTVDKFSKGVRSAATKAIVAVAAIGAAFTRIIGTGAVFEETIVAAAARFPGEIRKGSEAFKALEDAARSVGATTEFTATQTAQALDFMALAGFGVEQSIAALPGVVDLATAAQLDLGRATDITTDTLGAFGLATKDPIKQLENLNRVNDVLVRTATTANTTVEQLFESISQGAPIAKKGGAEIETYAALTGRLANASIKGGRAGIVLKNAFTRMAAPAKEAQILMRRLGIRVSDSEGKMRDMIDILDDVGRATKNMGSTQQVATLNVLFGARAISGISVLLNDGTEVLKEYREGIRASGGATAKMAQTMRDTLIGRFRTLKSAIQDVEIAVFSLTEGPLAEVIDKMTDWVRVNGELIATNIGEFLLKIIDNFERIVFWVGAIGKALVVLFVLDKALKAIAITMALVNFIMGLNPMVRLALLIVAAVAGIIAAWEPIKSFFIGLWEDIVNSGPVQVLLEIMKFLFNPLQSISSGILKLFGVGGEEEGSEGQGSPAPVPQVVTPGESAARSIEERQTTTTAEVTIRDETGRAEVTGGRLGAGLTLQPSGAF